MEKLKLDVETLAVESFDVADDTVQAKGTVRAHSQHTVLDCSALTCFVSCAVESCTHLCC
jgi:hypothetical protein